MQLNRFVCQTEFPPVPEAASWIENNTFSPDQPLIDVSQAVPGYATAPALLEHLAQTLTQTNVAGYGPVPGMHALREAYADSLGTGVDASQVAVTAGCNQAFYVAVAALCQPGSNVILPSPWYFNHKMSLDMLGVEALPLACQTDDQLIPDPQRAAELITPATRAIVLISPNNPTGQVYPAEVIDSFYTLCGDKGIALIIDETYRDFREHPAQAPHHIFADPDWPSTAIHLYSFSKAYALAGYRVGALVAAQAIIHEVTKVLDCITICAAQLSQHAALYGLQHASAWKEEKRQLMFSRADAFKQAMGDAGHGFEIAAMGPYFAYVKHPYPHLPSRTVARQLAEHSALLALPGDMFGDDQGDFLRVAFANVSAETMPAIAARLARHRPQ